MMRMMMDSRDGESDKKDVWDEQGEPNIHSTLGFERSALSQFT